MTRTHSLPFSQRPFFLLSTLASFNSCFPLFFLSFLSCKSGGFNYFYSINLLLLFPLLYAVSTVNDNISSPTPVHLGVFSNFAALSLSLSLSLSPPPIDSSPSSSPKIFNFLNPFQTAFFQEDCIASVVGTLGNCNRICVVCR